MVKLYEERIELVNQILNFIGVSDAERQICEEELYDSVTGVAEAIMSIKDADSDITGECSEQLINKILEHFAKY